MLLLAGPSLLLGLLAACVALIMWSGPAPDGTSSLRDRDALLVLALAGVLLLPFVHVLTAFFGFDLDPDDRYLYDWDGRRTAAVASLAVRAVQAVGVAGLAVLGCSRPWTGIRVALAVVAVGAAALFAAVDLPAAVAELARIDVESHLHPYGYP